MMRRVFLRLLPVSLALVAIGGFFFTAAAQAAGAVTPPDVSLTDLLKPLYEAFSGGHYAYAAALLTIAIVTLVKRWLADKIPFLHTDAGGALLAVCAAMASAVATALAAPGAAVSWSLMKSSFLVGVGAAGGFTVLNDVIVKPLLKPLRAKLPSWAQPILDLVLFFFDKKLAGEDAIAKAEKAGNDAVAANPAPGTAAVIGKPADVK